MDRALMAGKRNVESVNALVGGVMGEYEAVVADITKEARGRRPAPGLREANAVKKSVWIQGVLLVACGVLLGLTLDRAWVHGVMPGAAAQERRPPLPTMESLPEEVAQLKAIIPSNSHIMMDVQWMWMNMWFAAQQKNWPLAQYFFNEARNHIRWLVTRSPTTRGPDGKDVDLKGIFDGIDTSSLAAVKTAIEKQNSVQFAATYRTMLESCYACHKSAGRPYIRPRVPTRESQSMLNFNPNAVWPE